jgi:serine/threonine protein kinase/tetratricopeptide (TPR) repeat protein
MPAKEPGERGDSTKKNLGPYEILEEIGRGGMGVVYKAYHPQLKRTVALKVLIAGEDASEEAIERFHREAESVAKLGHHPNIVPVYDIGQAGNNHYIAMHLVEGTSIDQMIEDGEMTPRRAAILTQKLAEALQHAHDHGILHRDVKPSNVLMAFPRLEGELPGETKGEIPKLNDTGSGRSGRAEGASGKSGSEPLLTDFGLAKDVASETKMTRSGMTLGSPQYMPPEQARGDLANIDERSDVYALGATLYDMLTLRPPHEGDNVVEVIHKVLFKEPVSPRRLNPSVKRDLETICLTCLEKDPERRFASAGALARDLQNFLEGSPIAARPASLRYRVWKKVRRHRALSVTMATASVLLVAGTIIAGLALRGAEHRRAEADAGMADALRHAEQEGKRASTEEAGRILEQKQRRAVEVVLAAQVRLGKIHEELKRNFFDNTRTGREKADFYEKRRAKIEKFFAPYIADSSDPASAATALALKAWLTRFGGHPAEAVKLYARSRELDPDVGWGRLLDAMVELSEVLIGQRLPRFVLKADREIEFGPAPPDGAPVRKAKARLETLLGPEEEERGETLCGMERSLLRGLTKYGGDAKERERSLTATLEVPELFWIRSWLLLARAKTRFTLLDFDGATRDFTELIEELPNYAFLYGLRGSVIKAKARSAAVRGEDPRPLLYKAIKEYDEAVARDPGFTGAYGNRGTAFMDLGMAEVARREDPSEAYRKAIEDLSRALADDTDPVRGHINRGNAYRLLGVWEGEKGKDPRGRFGRAIKDLTQALEMDPEHSFAANSRGIALLSLGMAEAARGGDPRASYRKAIDDFDKAVTGDPRDAKVFKDQGTAYWGLGKAKAARGEDSGPSFEGAIAAFTKAVETDPQSWLVQANRGILLESQGRFEEAVSAYEKALAVVKRRSPRLEAMLDRAMALVSAPLHERQRARADNAMEWRDYATARGLYEKALAGWEASAGGTVQPDPYFTAALYNLACIYSLMSAGRSGPKAEPKPLPKEKTAELQQKALTSLGKAFRLGFSDLATLRKDPDLNPIRSLPAFKALVKEWEEKIGEKK